MTLFEETVGEISVCTDCMLMHANGEIGPDRPADEPEPWSLLRFGESVTLGGTHAADCPNIDGQGDVDCDCDTLGFSHTSCEGCGTRLYGDRFTFTLWRATSYALSMRAFDALGTARRASGRPERIRALDCAARNRRALAELHGNR